MKLTYAQTEVGFNFDFSFIGTKGKFSIVFSNVGIETKQVS